jgi:mRNA interferase RelE/StbE
VAWTIEWQLSALKAFKKLDKTVQRRIMTFVDETLVNIENPHSTGKAMVGSYKGLWRYRVGDYRLICQIQESKFTILVVSVGHRRNIYD